MFWTLYHELRILVINLLSLRCISWWSRHIDSHHVGSLLVGPKSSADPIWFVICEFKGSGRLIIFLWHTFCNQKHCSWWKDAWIVNAFSMGTNELIMIIMSQGSVTLWYVFFCWFDVLCHFALYIQFIQLILQGGFILFTSMMNESSQNKTQYDCL